MTAMRSRLATTVALVLVVAASGCNESSSGTSATGSSRSLLSALATASIECSEIAALRGAPDVLLRGPALFHESFEEPSASGHGGVHRVVEVEDRGWLLVLARVRSFPTADRSASLAVVAFGAADEDGDPQGLLRREARARPDLGDAWQTLALFLPADDERRSISIWIEDAAKVDALVVRRPSATERIGATRSDLGPAGAHVLVTTTRVEKTDARSLLLPVGSRAAFELDVPVVAPRLDAVVSLHPLATAAPASLRISVAGRTVAERKLLRGKRALEPWQVDLGRFAGLRVGLELAVEGAPDTIVVVGDPWLLGGNPPRPGPNVVLISVDTLRRDALGCYGNARARTPAIDALASAGVRFARATSPSSVTMPAHASLFTGQHPLVHGAIDPSRRLDPARSPMLGERMAAAGWQTAAFTGGGLVNPDFGFGLGFGSYSFEEPSGLTRMFRASPATLTEDGTRFAAQRPITEWIERRRDQPFFLFVHTYFVHNYVPNRDFAERHGARHLPLLPLADGTTPGTLASRLLAREQEPGFGAELAKLYQASVDELDARFIGPLLDDLERLGLDEKTLVVLTSDHGDQFQEHGSLFHGRHLWSELVDVPLLMRGPGIEVGAVREDPARLEDVAPTLARRLGIAEDERCFGRDLFAERDADEPVVRLFHLDHRDGSRRFRWDGLAFGRFKLLRQLEEGAEPREWLFDTEADPGEQHDLARSRTEERLHLARRLDAACLETLDAAARLPGSALERAGDLEELNRKLEELGYGVK